jgi:hypothetical protein
MNPIIAKLRAAYINVHNRRLVDRYLKANVRLLLGLTNTARDGLANARALAHGGNVLAPIAYSASTARSDLAAFLVTLARRMTVQLPVAASLDVVLNAPFGCEVAPYACLARLFHSRVNVHMAWQGQDAEALLPTLAPPAQVAPLQSELTAAAHDMLEVTPDLMGRLRARQFYANQAREFLKSRGWAARYCALSLPAEWPAGEAVDVLARVASRYPEWRFVLLGGPDDIAVSPSDSSERLIISRFLGVDFSTEMALAMEVDAYCGVADHYGVATVLAGKSATIVETEAYSAIRIRSFPDASIAADATISSFDRTLSELITRATDSSDAPT